MQGRLITAPPNCWDGEQPFGPGDYWVDADGVWHGCTPNGLLANLKNHTVVVHEDNTISVSPSIMVNNQICIWHGYLKMGEWMEFY